MKDKNSLYSVVVTEYREIFSFYALTWMEFWNYIRAVNLVLYSEGLTPSYFRKIEEKYVASL